MPHRPLLHFRAFAAVAAALLIPLPTTAQDETERIDEIFAWATPSSPGCVLAVSRHGELVFERAYGSADLERHVAMSTESVFDVGSLRKQFLAAAALMLVEDGALALDGDVRDHLPELPDYGHTITLDHLLTHTSGIRDWTGMLALSGGEVDVLHLILRQRALNFAPGEQWSYSNSGYVLVKELVERASGRSFASFARERLFEPLGMTHTAYHDDLNRVIDNRALPYGEEQGAWRLDLLVDNERGGGGALMSTAADLVRWNDALTSDRLGAFVTGKLEEPVRLRNGRQLTYARGVIADSSDGFAAFVHTGGAGGYSSWLGRFPQFGLSIALLCNADSMGTSRLANRVADLFLPAPADDRPGEAIAEVANVDVGGKAGLFFADDTGDELRLVARGGQLRVDGGGPLVAVAPDRFRNARPSLFCRSEDRFELRFVTPDEIELTSMEGDVARYRRARPWSPTADELAALFGRYESDELLSALEVVPAAGGAVLRFALAPQKTLPLQPVAPDVLAVHRMLLRFRRDANGGVIGFDYGNPVVRGIRYTRTGAAARSPSAAAAPAAPPEVQIERVADPATLCGTYEGLAGRAVTVRLENGKLYGQPKGHTERELVHRSGTTFDVVGAPSTTTFTFELDAEGRPTGIVVRQGSGQRTFVRSR